MTDTCTYPPDDCHGGHIINISPVTVGGTGQSMDALRSHLDACAYCRLSETPPAHLTDEQLRRLTAYVHPDEATDYVRPWLHSLAAELLAARARITELEAEGDGWQELSAKWNARFAQLTAHGADLERRGRELEAAQRADRCQVTTVDPSRPDRPSCAWCVLPAGHQGMHRAELPQDHSAPATLEWPSEVTE